MKIYKTAVKLQEVKWSKKGSNITEPARQISILFTKQFKQRKKS
jgi:hypothetical protein